LGQYSVHFNAYFRVLFQSEILMQRGPISKFIENEFLHFNAAALVDAAKGYERHLADGGKMMITLAGAMSTAELGKSLAEMIRRDKVQIISCTGANLEEDIMKDRKSVV
jgi:deoxyhypusine synthase